MAVCGRKTEIYSRVCGYFRQVSQYNIGKKEEWRERLNFDLKRAQQKREKNIA